MAAPHRKGIGRQAKAALPLYWPHIERFVKRWETDIKISKPWIKALFMIAHDPSWLTREGGSIYPSHMFIQHFQAEPDFMAAFLNFARKLIRTKRSSKRFFIQEWILINAPSFRRPPFKHSQDEWKHESADWSHDEIAWRISQTYKSRKDHKVINGDDVRVAENQLRRFLSRV